MGIRPDPHAISGLHVLVTGDAGSDGRARREALRSGIDGLLAGWGWQWANLGSGRRLCCLASGEPAPPVSVSYSGPVALLLVSADWRNVGVDLEISRPHRGMRYARITEAFGGFGPANALATFVRAEAWAKAADYGFTFGPGYFLRESDRAGLRPDGRLIRDIDLAGRLAGHVSADSLVAAAICTEADAPRPVIHPNLIIRSAERSAA